jgi:hypothetical protein
MCLIWLWMGGCVQIFGMVALQQRVFMLDQLNAIIEHDRKSKREYKERDIQIRKRRARQLRVVFLTTMIEYFQRQKRYHTRWGGRFQHANMQKLKELGLDSTGAAATAAASAGGKDGKDPKTGAPTSGATAASAAAAAAAATPMNPHSSTSFDTLDSAIERLREERRSYADVGQTFMDEREDAAGGAERVMWSHADDTAHVKETKVVEPSAGRLPTLFERPNQTPQAQSATTTTTAGSAGADHKDEKQPAGAGAGAGAGAHEEFSSVSLAASYAATESSTHPATAGATTGTTDPTQQQPLPSASPTSQPQQQQRKVIITYTGSTYAIQDASTIPEEPVLTNDFFTCDPATWPQKAIEFLAFNSEYPEVARDENADRWTVFFTALWNFICAHSALWCYLIAVVNHLFSRNVLSVGTCVAQMQRVGRELTHLSAVLDLVLAGYPVLIFLFALIEKDEPPAQFWNLMLGYTELCIILKSILR